MLYMIKQYGELALINGSDQAYVVLMPIQGRSDRDYIESHRDGLIATSSSLAGGDTITCPVSGGDMYLVTTTPSTERTEQGISSFRCVKTNITINVKRLQNTYDNNGNITGQAWNNIVTDIPAYRDDIAYQRMFQQDPGMVPRQSFQVTIQATNNVQLLDRVVFSGENYQVDAIDTISSPGNKVVDVSLDTRP